MRNKPLHWTADQMHAYNWAPYKEEIIAEQVKQLYALVPFGIAATLLNSVIVFFMLKNVMPQGILFIWFAAIMVITMFRIVLAIRFRRTEFQPVSARVWGNRFIVGLTLSGIAWGSIGFFPFSGGVSLAHQVFIAFVLGGMAAGSSATFSVSKEGYLAYSVPALVPLAARFFLMNDIFHYAMGGMLSLYGVLLWRISRRHYLVNTTSLLLRFENRGMIDQLRSAKEDMEKLYNKLLTESEAKLKVEAELRAHHDHLESVIEERTSKIASLAAIVDSSADAIIGVTLEGIIVSWNPGAAKLSGYSDKEAIGRSITLLSPPDRPDDIPAILDKIGRGQTIAAYDTSRMRKDGTLLDVSITVSPIKDSTGKIIGASAIARDITDQKKLEERVKRYSNELERSNRELDNFASIAAHDLRAPLRVVSGFAVLLQKHYKEKLDAEADRYISHIVEGIGRMNHLINDLLQYARVGTREKPLVPVDVNAIIEKTLANLTYEIKESSAVITVDSLPTVYADSTQLIQLFQNLVGNAIKYRSNTPRIHISAERKDGEWLFRVSDNGIGIDPRQFDRIFEIFQRLCASDEYSGTGIGLAICKKIVERLGGRIWVESKPGEGSTFFFTLPVTKS